MGERLNGIQEVVGSTPIPSTIYINSSTCYVYILQSLTTGRFYIGQCDHLIERFNEHRNGYSKATRHSGPWWMPYYESHRDRHTACLRERDLKRKKSAVYIRELIEASFPGILHLSSEASMTHRENGPNAFGQVASKLQEI